MLTDIATMIWKEWRELLRLGGSRRRAITRMLFSVGILGVIWPWQLGVRFITTPLCVILSAITASMYVAGMVPDSIAGERERHTLETLLASRLPDSSILIGKISALIVYGLGSSFVMLAIGWMTVNVVNGGEPLLFYSVQKILAAILFSILAAGLMGAAGVLVSLRASTVKQAQQVLTTSMLLLLFLPLIALPLIPREWRDAVTEMLQSWETPGAAAFLAVTVLVLQVLLYAIVAARFRRSRLILDQ
jgi:ABC-2 type transport system permease protein